MNNIPIVVGVTGHRKLRKEDYPLLKERVKEELNKIKTKCPNSPLVLLDSIALGGDAICAKAALELGYELEVPLPFESSEYEKDFDEESLKEYFDLKSKAKRVYELNKISDLNERDDGYRNAGLYIATHSHIIIALWDGEKGKPGGCGTAEFVDYVREGFDPSIIVPTPFITIIHISAIRENKQGESGVVKYYERKPGCTDKLLKDTDNFNRDVKEKNFTTYPLINKEVLKTKSQNLNDCHELYEKADSFSLFYQNKYLHTMKYSSVLGVGIVLSLLFYNQIGIVWFLIFYALLPVISKLIVDREKKGKYLERYIEARALAESARVQIFLLCSGVDKSVAYAYPWSIREDNDWIIKAMMTRLTYDEHNNDFNPELSKELIINQCEYHKKALNKEKLNNAKVKRGSKIISCITYINYAVVFISEFINLPFTKDVLFTLGSYPFTFKTIFKITLGIISAIAALMNNYYGKMSLSRKIEDHKRYIDLYEEVLKKIDNNDKKFIWEIAREELGENSSWRTYIKTNSPKVIIK